MTAEGGVICSGVQSATHMILSRRPVGCSVVEVTAVRRIMNCYLFMSLIGIALLSIHNHVTSDDVDESTSYDVSGNNIRVATMEL